MEVTGDITWNERLEELIAEEGEKALCFAWLHNKSEAMYSYRNNFIALPVIVLSTLAGTASIGSDSLFPKDSGLASIAIGMVSITVGILNTVGQYFSWAKRSEGHRIAHITYQKLFRFISVEMSLPRHERMAASGLLKVVREQYDRLSETSPMVPPRILELFQSKFKRKYIDVAKPEITNGLEKIYIYKEVLDGNGRQTPMLKRENILGTPHATPHVLATPQDTPQSAAPTSPVIVVTKRQQQQSRRFSLDAKGPKVSLSAARSVFQQAVRRTSTDGSEAGTDGTGDTAGSTEADSSFSVANPMIGVAGAARPDDAARIADNAHRIERMEQKATAPHTTIDIID